MRVSVSQGGTGNLSHVTPNTSLGLVQATPSRVLPSPTVNTREALGKPRPLQPRPLPYLTGFSPVWFPSSLSQEPFWLSLIQMSSWTCSRRPPSSGTRSAKRRRFLLLGWRRSLRQPNMVRANTSLSCSATSQQEEPLVHLLSFLQEESRRSPSRRLLPPSPSSRMSKTKKTAGGANLGAPADALLLRAPWRCVYFCVCVSSSAWRLLLPHSELSQSEPWLRSRWPRNPT